MNPDLESLLTPLRHDGPRRFALWNAALFEEVAHGPAAALHQKLHGQPQAAAVLTGYLRLVQQAIGTALLTRPCAGPVAWTSFLERALVELVPELLPRERPVDQLPLLVKLWNLGEGLRREPQWVDAYVCALAGGLRRLGELEPFLVRLLEPVLTPPAPAAWTGQAALQVLDFRPHHEEFLPGPMYLAAPCVLCVQDRRLPGVQMGVLFRAGRQSQVLGLSQGLGEYAEEAEKPAVWFADQSVRVGKQTVPLPLLRRPHAHVVARAGFVAASAVDSQRLWVVESA
jgi:hypothetical protein